MPLVRGASRPWGGRRARFMQRFWLRHGAIPRTNRRSFSHALVRRKKGVCELGSIGSDPKRRPWQRSKSLVQRFALRLIRRAPPAIGAQSALQTIAIDSQTVCAPFLASAARHNQKTKHPAKSIPSKTPRAVASCTEPQRRNSRAAATNSTPRWPTPTNHRSRRPRPPKRRPRRRPPP